MLILERSDEGPRQRSSIQVWGEPQLCRFGVLLMLETGEVTGGLGPVAAWLFACNCDVLFPRHVRGDGNTEVLH